jgi:hypothetical protein
MHRQRGSDDGGRLGGVGTQQQHQERKWHVHRERKSEICLQNQNSRTMDILAKKNRVSHGETHHENKEIDLNYISEEELADQVEG